MKKNGFSHIRRWLWLYLFIVVFTTLAAYLIVYNEISSLLTLHASMFDATNSTAAQESSATLLAGIKLRILLLLTAGFLAVLFFSIVWLRSASRQINRPISAIRRAVFRLAQGKLNETVTIDSSDEFGQIGSGINELAANLQELLLYIWKQTGQCLTTVERIKNNSNLQDDQRLSAETTLHLQELSAAIENLREMAKSYVFYDVRLDGEHAVAINQPGREEPPE